MPHVVVTIVVLYQVLPSLWNIKNYTKLYKISTIILSLIWEGLPFCYYSPFRTGDIFTRRYKQPKETNYRQIEKDILDEVMGPKVSGSQYNGGNFHDSFVLCQFGGGFSIWFGHLYKKPQSMSGKNFTTAHYVTLSITNWSCLIISSTNTISPTTVLFEDVEILTYQVIRQLTNNKKATLHWFYSRNISFSCAAFSTNFLVKILPCWWVDAGDDAATD